MGIMQDVGKFRGKISSRYRKIQKKKDYCKVIRNIDQGRIKGQGKCRKRNSAEDLGKFKKKTSPRKKSYKI